RLSAFTRFVGSLPGGTGRGIFPRGPRTTPRRLPIVGMSGASARKKSMSLTTFLTFFLSFAKSSSSFAATTRSATPRIFWQSWGEPNTATFTVLPRPWGRGTSSSRRFFGTVRSRSLRLIESSTVSENFRSVAFPRASVTTSTAERSGIVSSETLKRGRAEKASLLKRSLRALSAEARRAVFDDRARDFAADPVDRLPEADARRSGGARSRQSAPQCLYTKPVSPPADALPEDRLDLLPEV